MLPVSLSIDIHSISGASSTSRTSKHRILFADQILVGRVVRTASFLARTYSLNSRGGIAHVCDYFLISYTFL